MGGPAGPQPCVSTLSGCRGWRPSWVSPGPGLPLGQRPLAGETTASWALREGRAESLRGSRSHFSLRAAAAAPTWPHGQFGQAGWREAPERSALTRPARSGRQAQASCCAGTARAAGTNSPAFRSSCVPKSTRSPVLPTPSLAFLDPCSLWGGREGRGNETRPWSGWPLCSGCRERTGDRTRG